MLQPTQAERTHLDAMAEAGPTIAILLQGQILSGHLVSTTSTPRQQPNHSEHQVSTTRARQLFVAMEHFRIQCPAAEHVHGMVEFVDGFDNRLRLDSGN